MTDTNQPLRKERFLKARQQHIMSENIRKVYDAEREIGPGVTGAMTAERTGLSRVTVMKYRAMIKAGWKP